MLVNVFRMRIPNKIRCAIIVAIMVDMVNFKACAVLYCQITTAPSKGYNAVNRATFAIQGNIIPPVFILVRGQFITCFAVDNTATTRTSIVLKSGNGFVTLFAIVRYRFL